MTTPATTPKATGSALESTQGKTTIADAVVAKVAGLAAREISGVHDFGDSAARAFGAITERIPGSRSAVTQGVAVEVGERQAAVDLTTGSDAPWGRQDSRPRFGSSITIELRRGPRPCPRGAATRAARHVGSIAALPGEVRPDGDLPIATT